MKIPTEAADKYGYARNPSALCFFFYGNRIMPDDLKARLKTFVPPPAEAKVQSLEQLPTMYDRRSTGPSRFRSWSASSSVRPSGSSFPCFVSSMPVKSP